jgi:uncharacterized peroxidase-related enzyme
MPLPFVYSWNIYQNSENQTNMPYISVEDHLPGITGLLEFRRDTADPIRDLTQTLLRGESTLTAAEREMIATLVSHLNECRFCSTAHQSVTDRLLGECETSASIRENFETAPLGEKMKSLLNLAAQVQSGGYKVTPSAIDRAKAAGATDVEIHDTVLIAALFCLYNRYVDGLATIAPEEPEFYRRLASRIETSYERSPTGYDHLKKDRHP